MPKIKKFLKSELQLNAKYHPEIEKRQNQLQKSILAVNSKHSSLLTV